jgi:Flp pilus assembly protein TadG
VIIKRLLYDRSGATAMEFGIIGVLVFTMTFAIFDLGRYAITLHSLEMLAAESARAEIICYSPYLSGSTARTCSGDPLTVAAKRTLFPFLFLGGLAPTVTTTTTAPHVVQASQTGFRMIMPFWPASMKAPSVRTSLPF